MKRLQLITLVLLTIFALSCTKDDITTTNLEPTSSGVVMAIYIPDIVFRTEVLRQLGRTDGPITRADALTITELKFGNMWVRNDPEIGSLEGIEHFKNLEKLSVQLHGFYGPENTLSTLKLENFPRLRELTYNDCEATSITLVNCPQLEKIDCSFNELSDINESLAGLSKLKWLDCSYNILGYSEYSTETYVLDLSHCTDLKYLDCAENYYCLRFILVPIGQTFDYLNLSIHARVVEEAHLIPIPNNL